MLEQIATQELLAECVRGEEAISEAYTFTISALSQDAGISLRALLGQPALLELLTVNSVTGTRIRQGCHS